MHKTGNKISRFFRMLWNMAIRVIVNVSDMHYRFRLVVHFNLLKRITAGHFIECMLGRIKHLNQYVLLASRKNVADIPMPLDFLAQSFFESLLWIFGALLKFIKYYEQFLFCSIGRQNLQGLLQVVGLFFWRDRSREGRKPGNRVQTTAHLQPRCAL